MTIRGCSARLLIAALCLPLIVPSTAGAALQQTAAVSAPIPAEAAAKRFLEAFNAPSSMEPFIASSFTSVSLAREPAGQRAAAFDRLKANSGGFRLLSSKAEGERMVEMVVASNRGNRHGRIVLFTSSKEPGKIADIFVLSARDPSRAAADEFPEKPVPAARVAAEIERRVDSLAEEDRFSGAILVARGDQVLLREARGFANQTWRVPMRADTRMHTGSVSKMFTAAAVMRLVEQGKLSLDDTLGKRVPAYPHPEAASKITLRHLLTHTAALGDWDGRELGAISASEAAASMKAPPTGEPGERLAYSNAGFVLLGAAVEQATGLPFPEAVRTLVFEPAGMKNSGYWPVTAIVPNRATGYLRPPSDPLGFGPRFSNEQFLGSTGDGSGGAYSTVDDLFAFHRALANGRLVRASTHEQMIGQAVEFPGTPRPSRYGFGLRLTDCAGEPTLGHSGGGPNSGVSDATYASLDGDWTVIVLSNYDPPTGEDLALAVCEFVHRQP